MLAFKWYIPSNDSVNNGQTSVERQLRNLGSGKLAVRIAESHHSAIIFTRVCVGADTVETGLPNGVLDGSRVVEVDSGGEDGVLGGIGRVLRQEEGANLVFRTQLCINIGRIADSFLDLFLS